MTPTRLFFAAILAAVMGLGSLSLAPAKAASIPSNTAISLDQASKPEAQSVRYHGRRHYRPVRAYHRPVMVRRHHVRRPVYSSRRPVYYGAPVYYRSCVMRKRWVWTHYGHVRRWVRVCR